MEVAARRDMATDSAWGTRLTSAYQPSADDRTCPAASARVNIYEAAARPARLLHRVSADGTVRGFTLPATSGC